MKHDWQQRKHMLQEADRLVVETYWVCENCGEILERCDPPRVVPPCDEGTARRVLES